MKKSEKLIIAAVIFTVNFLLIAGADANWQKKETNSALAEEVN